MQVIHSSLRPFVNSSPVLFPESDRRLGVIARMQEGRNGIETTITVETESPSFVSTCTGETVDDTLLDNTDSIIRSNLLSLAAQCEKTAEELLTHAKRFRKIAAQKAVVDEVEVESRDVKERIKNNQHTTVAIPSRASTLSSSPRSSRLSLDLEDI